MNTLIKDIIIKICDILCDRDKFKFLSTSKKNRTYKYDVFYNDKINIKKIVESEYFDRFTNIIITGSRRKNKINKVPKHLIKLRLNSFGGTKLDKIPASVTKLTLFGHCNENILQNLPQTLIKLIIDIQIERNIKGYIPKNVTHFCIRDLKNISLIECLPENLTHLILGYNYEKNIARYIPKNVKYLYINYTGNEKIELNYGITHLIIGDYCRGSFDIPTSVTNLAIGGIYRTEQKSYRTNYDIKWTTDMPNSATETVYGSDNESINIVCDKSVRNKHEIQDIMHTILWNYNKICSNKTDNKIINWDDVPAHIKSISISNRIEMKYFDK